MKKGKEGGSAGQTEIGILLEHFLFRNISFLGVFSFREYVLFWNLLLYSDFFFVASETIQASF